MADLSWSFSVEDGLSGPSLKMGQSLRQLGGSLSQVEGQLRQVDRAIKLQSLSKETNPLMRHKMALELHRDALQDQAGAAQKGGAGLLGFARDVTVVGGAVVGAVQQIASLAMGIGGVVVSLSQFAIRAASFKSNTINAFALIEGSVEKATESWRVFNKFADSTPFETQDVMRQVQGFRMVGLSARETQDVLTAVFDVASLRGEEGAQAIDSMTLALRKALGAGKLTGETLMMLSEGSGGLVNIGSIVKNIAAVRHVTQDQARKLIETGKVSAQEGINAFMTAVRTDIDKGQALGTATQLFGVQSWEGSISTFKSRLEGLFEDIKIGPLKDVLANVNKLLDPESPAGAKIKESFGRLFGGLFEGASKLLTPENITKALDMIGMGVDLVIVAFERGWPLLERFWTTFSTSMEPVKAMLPLFGQIWSSFRGAGGATVAIEMLARAMGTGLTITSAFLLQWFALAAGIASVSATLFGIGVNIVEGLWNGIKSTWGWMLEQFKGLVGLLPDAAKAALGIASPAKELMPVGRFSMQGIVGGAEAEADAAGREFGQLVRGATDVSGSVVGAAGGGGRAITVTFGDIIIQGPAGDLNSLVDRIRERARQGVFDALEELALA